MRTGTSGATVCLVGVLAVTALAQDVLTDAGPAPGVGDPLPGKTTAVVPGATLPPSFWGGGDGGDGGDGGIAGVASDCCFDNGSPGCDDPSCEADVCGVDPFCCDTVWDGVCAEQAFFICGGLCGITDFLGTDPDPLLTQVTFGSPDIPPIPADFFGPGSDPFIGTVLFEGVPLAPAFTEDSSTAMRRLDDPIQLSDLPGTEGFVPIQLEELHLQSVNPINVIVSGQPTLWDVQVTLPDDHQTPPGQLFALKTHVNGGTFSADFFVQPVFVFTNQDDPIDVVFLDTGQIPLPPLHLTFPSANWVHDVNPALETVPSEPPSSFVPFVTETIPGDPDSQLITPSTSISDGNGVTHTVIPGGPKVGRCEVVSKTVPNNLSACMNTDAGGGRRNIFVTFTMDASFRSNTQCCEFRQLVKGEFKVNGKKLNHCLPDDDGDGTNEMLEKDTYHEDGICNPDPGVNEHYGHRDEGATDASDVYSNPNRATGSMYAGSDAPGLYGVPTGRTYSVDLMFLAFIIDTCNKISLLPTHEWNVTCTGTALGPPPEPLVEVLFDTFINGRPSILGVYIYPPGGTLTVVASIANGAGLVPIDASEVTITVDGLVEIGAPPPGPLMETELRSVSSHALYDFDYPPGSPNPVGVNFTFGAETQSFAADVTLPCPWDLDGSGAVAVNDLLDLLAAWGTDPGGPPDFNGDGTVAITDLLALLAAWGPCP